MVKNGNWSPRSGTLHFLWTSNCRNSSVCEVPATRWNFVCREKRAGVTGLKGNHDLSFKLIYCAFEPRTRIVLSLECLDLRFLVCLSFVSVWWHVFEALHVHSCCCDGPGMSLERTTFFLKVNVSFIIWYLRDTPIPIPAYIVAYPDLSACWVCKTGSINGQKWCNIDIILLLYQIVFFFKFVFRQKFRIFVKNVRQYVYVFLGLHCLFLLPSLTFGFMIVWLSLCSLLVGCSKVDWLHCSFSCSRFRHWVPCRFAARAVWRHWSAMRSTCRLKRMRRL